MLEERARTGRTAGEVTFIRGDGSRFEAEFSSVILPNSSRGPQSFVIFSDITERKNSEEALRQSEGRLLQAQAVAHVGNWELDLATKVMWASEEAFRIYGVTRESPFVSLEFVQSLSLPEERARLDEALQRLISGQSDYDMEFRITRVSDGALRVVRSAAQLTRDQNGAPAKVLGAVQDVTERRFTEERLRLTQYSVDHAADAIEWCDSRGRIVWASDSLCRTLGYSLRELLTMSLFDVDPALTVERWSVDWVRMKEQGPFTLETVHRKKNGEEFPVEVNVNHVQFEGREYNCAFVRDISERRRSEERANWLTRVLDHSLNEVYIFDAETLRFVQVNQGAQSNLGYSMDELADMTPSDLTPAITPESFARSIEPLREGLERQLVVNTEHRRKDGSLYPVEVHLQLTEREPRPVFLAVILDITERKAAEEALRASEEQLRQSQKMEAIGQLAGGIAHDFNNLLTAIIGYADLLLVDLPGDDGTMRPDLEQIKRSAERAGSLTRQILAFSRRQALRPRVVSLNEVIAGMEPLLRRSLGEQIDLLVTQQPGLGLVEVDTHQFEQVLMNLAVNARDAMPAGGRLTIETADVELDAEFAAAHVDVTPGSHVMLAVSDTGRGMDEETLTHIYEPFFTTKGVGEGTGLGLSTVYGIVRQSGGSITVESRVGGGSTFRLYLPRVSLSASPAGAGAEAVRPIRALTVLLVEDEPALRSLVERVLTDRGYQVVVAGSGPEALEALKNQTRPPDLLLTDVILPGGMQGNQLAKHLLRSFPGLSVLYMSGYARDSIVREGPSDKGVDCLEKPFTPESLAAAVKRALDKRG